MHPLKVSLEELYNGTTKKLSLAKNVICNKCDGCALHDFSVHCHRAQASENIF